MKSGLRRSLALALGLCTLTAGASAASVTFSDVPSRYWGYSHITKAASNGLVSGLGDGRYGPEEKLSNAHFVTMICGMFYEDEVSAQGSSSDWWRPYLNAAYSAGILKGTQAAQQRASAGDWSASVANAQISRYDMAQIMYHVAVDQGFEAPSAASLAYSSARIRDFSSIPSNYQYAVLYSYAKGFLSGDDQGRFNGGNSPNRAEAAVVLCSLFEEQESLLSPTYNNSNRLTDNSAVTEENVSDLLRELEAEYPSFDQWNTNRVYTSKVLGRGSGEAGFAYMLSDRVFGAISSYELDDPEDLRVGDLLKLADNLNCARVDIFATAVLRNCANSEAATAAIETAINHRVRVLSAREEAHLGFVGASIGTPLAAGTLIDVGGGSTELTALAADGDHAGISIPFGCVLAYANYVRCVIPTPAECRTIADAFRKELQALPNLEGYRSERLYGIGGSVRALAKMVAAVWGDDTRPKSISRKDMEGLADLLQGDVSVFAHRAVKAAPDRVHSLVPGMIIVRTLAEELGAAEVIPCKYGIREGYLVTHML